MTDKTGNDSDHSAATSALQSLVSVIIPTRQELSTISKCLDSILGNSYPPDKTEIIVVDGMSSDGTRGIVEEYMARYPLVKLLDNRRLITPVALNIGIKAAHGDVIVILGAHSYVDKDFLSQSVKALSEHPEADCVGGVVYGIGGNLISKTIASALSSPFGVGNARFRTGNYEGFVDTVAFGAYRREVFEQIGFFDEIFIRNQDDEFNYRLIKGGGKIYLTPQIQYHYYVRPSLRKLWAQYFQYGYWKVRVIQKHRLPASWRHVVPTAFVISLVGSGISAIWSLWGLYALSIIVGSYLVASLLFSLIISLKKGLLYLPVLPLAFGAIHFSYGLGFLKGIWDFAVLRKHLKRKIEDVELTR